MTTYYVNSGAAGTQSGLSWTNAVITLQAALDLWTSAADVVLVHKSHVETLAADVTISALGACSIYVVDKDNSDALSTQDGTSAYIGHSSTSYGITFNGGFPVYIHGLAFRVPGTSAKNIVINSSDKGVFHLNGVKFLLETTSTTAVITFGSTTSASSILTRLTDCTINFGAADQKINPSSKIEIDNLTLTGTAPSYLFSGNTLGEVLITNSDLSTITTALFADIGYRPYTHVLRNCKIGSAGMLVATTVGEAAGEVFLFDCSSGDYHFHIGHYNAVGSTVCDTGIYTGDNICDANLSWKIIGTSNATVTHPYKSPWISAFNNDISTAITPSLECVRSGSSTAYNNNEVWCEVAYKDTSGNPQGVIVNDRMTLLGSAAAQTTGSLGAGDWTGENATSWFGKLAPAASFTPAEVGHISARVCVAGANTVYVDPQIRGLS